MPASGQQQGVSSGLERIVAAVDVILNEVEGAPTELAEPERDVNDAFLRVAYGRAYPCLRSIRELAGRGEADDAMILVRSLLSIVARSLYLVAPEEATERERRFDSARRSWAEQALSALDALTAAGFEPADDRDRIARIATATKERGVPTLPNDRELLDALGLGAFYARVYKLASDVAHYSIGSALDGFLVDGLPDRLSGGGGRVALDIRDDKRAEEALALAAIIYGEFLERCEALIPHGVTAAVRREVVAYMNAPERTR
jgi:Family of unknown function (DUF5677)